MTITTSTPRLLKYDAARQALAEAHRVDEAKDIRDKAVAIATYAKQAQDRDMIFWATEIKVRAERRTGELLREREKHDGGRPAGKPVKIEDQFSSKPPKLADLKITKQQSSDWQALAAIPAPEFERRIKNAAGDPAALTTAKILKPAAVSTKPNPFEAEITAWGGVSEWLRRAPSMVEDILNPQGELFEGLATFVCIGTDAGGSSRFKRRRALTQPEYLHALALLRGHERHVAAKIVRYQNEYDSAAPFWQPGESFGEAFERASAAR